MKTIIKYLGCVLMLLAVTKASRPRYQCIRASLTVYKGPVCNLQGLVYNIKGQALV